MFVCIYVAIYFRAWYDGCGHENVRIFPGSAPALSRVKCSPQLRLNLYDEPVMGRTYYFEWVRHLAHRIKQLELISTCL